MQYKSVLNKNIIRVYRSKQNTLKQNFFIRML